MAVDDEYTVALFHFNGDDASTTFTDEAGHSASRTGNPELDTAIKKFGTASLYINGTGSVGTNFVTIIGDSDFDFRNQDFTIDFWAYSDLWTNTWTAVITSNGFQGASSWGVHFQHENIKACIAGSDRFTHQNAFGLDAWHHVALVKSGTTVSLFLDGVKSTSSYTTGQTDAWLADGQNGILLGRSGTNADNGDWNGYIDELRISRGIARWTANFTPPTAEYISPDISATCASLTLSANPATISYAIAIQAAYASLSVTAYQVIIGVGVEAACASLSVAAHDAEISLNIDVTAACALLTLAAHDADVKLQIPVAATCASLTIAPNAAAIQYDVDVLAACASLSISTPQADVNLNVSVSGTCAALTLAAYQADVEVDVIHVNATCATLNLAAYGVLISYDIDVEPTPAALAIATYDATIWDGAAWVAWITDHSHEITRLYYLTLTGDADGLSDLTLPMASFQARRRNGEPTFMAAVIPGTDYYDDIVARANGELVIDMAYLINGVEQYREDLVRVDYENIRYYEGGRNQSLIVEGHKTETFTSKGIDLNGVTYKAIDDGLMRFRCAAPEMFVNPGDTARYDGDAMTVAEMTLSVDPSLASMEVAEEA